MHVSRVGWVKRANLLPYGVFLNNGDKGFSQLPLMIAILLASLIKCDFMGIVRSRWVLCVPPWFVAAQEQDS